MNKKTLGFGVLVILFLGSAMTVYAAGTSSSTWPKEEQENKPVVSLYDQGVEASKNGDFKKALNLFEQTLQRDRSNPDILNMLAHSQLKLGMIDESLENYKKALKLRPDFPEAREYLGEAYIQAALREIKTLKGYGSQGAESLEELTAVFKEAAAGLE